MAITRQGVTHVHLDDARDEQALRIRAVELAIEAIKDPSMDADYVVATANKILNFITVDQTAKTTEEEPEKKLSHFGV